MRDFLINLAFLAVLAAGLFIVAPDIMRQIVGLYYVVGILPVIIILIIFKALPHKRRSRRR